ncbi:MAG: PRC-barrel domain containing protein [Longispora sp.]|nr:PRC-barrel domain containing protein [Longispora sp. (in: high G+C Gram-positive bacteria)]
MNSSPAWDPWSYSATTGYLPQGGMSLEGFNVEAVDGSIGHIDKGTDLVDETCIVVDTGPWIFGKKVMLPAGVVGRVDFEEEKVYVSCTKDQIKSSPKFDDEMPNGYQGKHESPDYREEVARYYATLPRGGGFL